MMMTKPVALTTGIGEIMAPQTLVTALILSPEGTVTVDAGALHGRSELESTVRFVQRKDEVPAPQVHWLVWVAVELDAANRLVRYRGIAVSELWIDPSARVGYKNVAETVNRMSEAMRGGMNLKTLDANARSLLRGRLSEFDVGVWDRTAQSLKAALQ